LLVISLGLIWVDGSGAKTSKSSTPWLPETMENSVASSLQRLRRAMLLLTGPVYFFAQSPYAVSGTVSDITADRQFLLQQRDQLNAQLLEMKEGQLRVHYLQAENTRLRQLLGSKAQLPSQAIIAEIIGVPPDPQRAAVILDKGEVDGIAPGYAVVDALGLIGQVTEVSSNISWVLLISDRNHAIPARINRTGVRMIVGGIGSPDRLVVEDLPVSTDLREGDLIETSGLGGRFPVGYPVGLVSSVESTQASPYLQAAVTPSAALLKVGHVLIIPPPLEKKASAVEQSADANEGES
jgi:rod shape-determining protein MreC